MRYALINKDETRDRVEARVKWWLNDLGFKAPEQLEGRWGEHYFDCMAKDIACTAVGDDDSPVMNRLDP